MLQFLWKKSFMIEFDTSINISAVIQLIIGVSRRFKGNKTLKFESFCRVWDKFAQARVLYQFQESFLLIGYNSY